MALRNYLSPVDMYKEIQRGIHLGREAKINKTLLEHLNTDNPEDRSKGAAALERIAEILTEVEHGFWINVGLEIGYRFTRRSAIAESTRE